jgi:hypothetical protein
MPVIQPTPIRYVAVDRGDSLEISIPSIKERFTILEIVGFIIHLGFSLVWLLLIRAFVAVAIAQGVAFLLTNCTTLFLLICFSLWSSYIILDLCGLLWRLSGKEVVLISDQAISTKSQIVGVGPKREIPAEQVTALQIVPVDQQGRSRLPMGWGMALQRWGLDAGMIEIRSEKRSFRFGCAIDEAEAKQIIAEIGQRFPQYVEG